MSELASLCLWCNGCFEPRSDGGRAQRFCRPACRHALDAAGRRWIAAALASGTLTIDGLKDRAASTCALLPGTTSAASGSRAHRRDYVQLDELSALLGDILDTLSPEELGWLREPHKQKLTAIFGRTGGRAHE
jgi:hypothetical protein